MCSARPFEEPTACDALSSTSAGSRSGAKGTHQTPSRYPSDARPAACAARRVFPVPPGPVSVSRRVPVEQADDFGQLALAAQERRRRHGQVRPIERFERRELATSELIDTLGSAEILEAMFAEVEQLDLGELGRGGGDEHLATVSGCRDTGSTMDVFAYVPLVGQERRPRVQPAPHPDLARCELPRQLLCRRERPRRRRERDEERITLRVHLDAVVVAQASRITRRCSASASA